MQYRNVRSSDLKPLIALLNLIRQVENLGEEANEDEMRHFFTAPHFKAEENFFVAIDEKEIVGLALQLLRPDTSLVVADISIHPDYRETDAAQNLLALTERRAVERLGGSVNMIMTAPDRKAYLRPVLYLAEYEEIRRSYQMHITLDKPMPEVEFPAGYQLRSFKTEDAKAVFAAFIESFAEHFGEVSKIPFEQWSHQISAPSFDPSIWHILYHGEEIAAICLCELSDRDARLGLVEALGVRPKHRQQGLGAALLRQSFKQFQERGFAAVALEVDADNSTNAVALYQSVGMSIASVTPAYHKVLKA